MFLLLVLRLVEPLDLPHPLFVLSNWKLVVRGMMLLYLFLGRKAYLAIWEFHPHVRPLQGLLANVVNDVSIL